MKSDKGCIEILKQELDEMKPELIEMIDFFSFAAGEEAKRKELEKLTELKSHFLESLRDLYVMINKHAEEDDFVGLISVAKNAIARFVDFEKSIYKEKDKGWTECSLAIKKSYLGLAKEQIKNYLEYFNGVRSDFIKKEGSNGIIVGTYKVIGTQS